MAEINTATAAISDIFLYEQNDVVGNSFHLATQKPALYRLQKYFGEFSGNRYVAQNERGDCRLYRKQN